MLPIVISLSISLVGVLAAVLLVSVALRGREGDEPEADQPSGGSNPSVRFFLDEVADPRSQLALSSEALRDQLQQHVLEEHEAAEAFLRTLNAESLHAPSKPNPRK